MRANARFLSGFTSHSDGIRVFSKFCTRRFAPYICILLTANLHAAAAFHSPFGHTCSNRTERIRLSLRKPAVFLPSQSFALMQTCPCAAPSVTACAVPPSSGRKALVLRTDQLVSPSGRDVAQRQRGLVPADMAFQICPDSNFPVFCPLSHLLRKCQLSQGESREAGANCTPDVSGYLLRRLARVLLLPSRLAPRHLPQGGRLCFSAQSKLVSPSGRDVAQRQRGLAPSSRELACRLAARLREFYKLARYA